jgi:hypothetical protein
MYRKASISLAAAFLVVACGPTLKQSSPAGGMLALGGLVQGESEAIRIAEAECAKHGKAARVTGKDMLAETMTYECVQVSE